MPNDVINTITIGGTTYDIGGSGGGSGRAINATLLANGWDTNKRQALQFIGYNVNQNGVIGMPTSVTSTQKTAYQDADIRIYSQSSDTFTFECGATVPTIDLPVTLFVTDASSTAAFVYKPAGSKTVAELISSLLVEANLGNVYNMTDSGTTTADFVEGAGKPIYAGDDVGIIDNGTSGSPSYKFNKLGGFIDLSNYIQKSNTSGLVKNDGTIDETEYQPAQEGKGLSTNDYDNTDKAKVGKIDETTQSATGNPISISDLKSNQLAVNPIITFEPIQAGSGTPSPSNIRAISGYDKVEVESCGKNLFNKDKTVLNKGMTPTGETSGTGQCYSDYIVVKPNTTYYLTNVYGSASYFSSVHFDKNFNIIGAKNVSGSGIQSGAITTYENSAYMVINTGMSIVDTVQIVEGNTAITYEPYVKATSISESLGQTVYGGSDEIRTGELISTHKLGDLGDLSWGSFSTGVFRAYATTDVKMDVASHVCEIYTCTNNYNTMMATNNTFCIITSGNERRIFVHDDRYSDYATFAAAVTGVKYAYELATPFTIQLTPHEISLLKDYAYVSTNGTNIALAYHNGEIASLSDVSQLGETVNELGDYVGANIKANEENLLTHTSSNPYEFPCDGYVIVYSGSATSGKIDLNLRSADNQAFGGINMEVVRTSQMQSTFVKKGMKAYLTQNTTASGSSVVVVFRGLKA